MFIYYGEVILKPLHKATANQSLEWTEECEAAFNEAKKILIQAPILHYPDFSEACKFVVTCDASGGGAGALVLTQIQNGEEKVMAYAGTSFNVAQLWYSPTDWELAAIRYAVNHFRLYLYGRNFLSQTDHEPLLYMYSMKKFDDCIHRTMKDLKIVHLVCLSTRHGKYSGRRLVTGQLLMGFSSR